jgi:hypothetical protein
MPEYTKVDVPRGTFFGWAVKPPQELVLKVVSFDLTGGTDAKDNVCPRLIGTVMEPTSSYRDKGTTEVKIDAGELLIVECSIWALKSGVAAAAPESGDIIKLVYVGNTELKSGTAKDIDVFIARGSSNTVTEEDV